jgi:cytochrome b
VKEAPRRLAVWDLPTRLFHWSLVGLVLFAWWSARTHHMAWHIAAGSLIAGLLAFRLWWGFFGGRTARFADFVKGPPTVLAYAASLRRRTAPSPGHNPMGGWSVVALLACCAAIVATGLFAVDTDAIDSGQLAFLVDFDTGRLASRLHGRCFTLLKLLVGLHLAAIAFYSLIKRDALIPAMLHGKKALQLTEPPLREAGLPALLGGLLLGLAVAGWLIWRAG